MQTTIPHIFLKNKYTRWYFSIISSARSLQRKKKQGIYYENHHIIPTKLGGLNEPNNLVLLTAKEHLICHRLLIRMLITDSTYWCSMVFAFKRMLDVGAHNFERKTHISSLHYTERRIKHSRAMSIVMTGRTMPPHVRAIISESNKGRKLSDQHKLAISQQNKEAYKCPELRKKISIERKSRTYSEDQRQKTIEGMKVVWDKRRNGKIEYPKKPVFYGPPKSKMNRPSKAKNDPMVRSKNISNSMKTVWEERRKNGIKISPRRPNSKSCGGTRWVNNGIINLRIKLDEIQNLDSSWALGRLLK